MSKFHKLKIKEIRRETADCVSLTFDIPSELASEFEYKQGQYLTLRTTINGEEIRRSYSVCSSPVADEELRIAVKRVENGKMSSYLNNGIKAGTELDVMNPMGNFYTEMPAKPSKNYVAFAAGSGITPIMSLLKTALATEESSRFTLFYGNRTSEETIFKSELDELSKKYDGRLEVVYLLSRESTSDPLFNGRISAEKCSELFRRFDQADQADEYFLCGPYDMILAIKEELKSRDIADEKIHFELFTTPVTDATSTPDTSDSQAEDFTGTSKVTIVLDGEETVIEVGEGENILDAALDAGLDAPYACTGSSCCTCRAKIMEGEAEMDVNYALTEKEVEEGYILTCQSHPKTPTMVVDYDEP
jgi:ring-1,2-phenylacetyl-CoA epoxidase subunit PaaE